MGAARLRARARPDTTAARPRPACAARARARVPTPTPAHPRAPHASPVPAGKSSALAAVSGLSPAYASALTVCSVESYYVLHGGGTYRFEASLLREAHAHCKRQFYAALRARVRGVADAPARRLRRRRRWGVRLAPPPAPPRPAQLTFPAPRPHAPRRPSCRRR